MRVRAVLTAAAVAALVAAPTLAFAQRGGGGAPRAGVVKSVDTGAKTITVTTRGRMNQEADVTVKTNDQTVFGIGNDPGTFADVKVGKFVVVTGTGNPNEGITGSE